MAKKTGNLLGSWAFLVGLILALVLGVGLSSSNPLFLSILIVIGLIVGLLNVADEETEPFLLSGAVLIIASGFGQSALADAPWAYNIFKALLIIFVPATVIVAIKNVFSLARH